MRIYLLYLAFCLLFALVTEASADVINFNFRSGGAAGMALAAGNSYTEGGVTVAASAGFNALSEQAGIGTGGQIDMGELLTLTFTGLPFELQALDLNGVGADSNDSATISVGGTSYELFTGAADFNGSGDLWSPSGIAVTTGGTIEFTASNAFGLQELTVSSVPEPGSFALVAICAMNGFVRRRKS